MSHIIFLCIARAFPLAWVDGYQVDISLIASFTNVFILANDCFHGTRPTQCMSYQGCVGNLGNRYPALGSSQSAGPEHVS